MTDNFVDFFLKRSEPAFDIFRRCRSAVCGGRRRRCRLFKCRRRPLRFGSRRRSRRRFVGGGRSIFLRRSFAILSHNLFETSAAAAASAHHGVELPRDSSGARSGRRLFLDFYRRFLEFRSALNLSKETSGNSTAARRSAARRESVRDVSGKKDSLTQQVSMRLRRARALLSF